MAQISIFSSGFSVPGTVPQGSHVNTAKRQQSPNNPASSGSADSYRTGSGSPATQALTCLNPIFVDFKKRLRHLRTTGSRREERASVKMQGGNSIEKNVGSSFGLKNILSFGFRFPTPIKRGS